MATYDHEPRRVSNQKSPKEMLSTSWWCGFFFHMAMTNGAQDWMGKAAVIQSLEESWMPTRWWMWAAIGVWVGVIHFYQRWRVS